MYEEQSEHRIDILRQELKNLIMELSEEQIQYLLLQFEKEDKN